MELQRLETHIAKQTREGAFGHRHEHVVHDPDPPVTGWRKGRAIGHETD